MIDLKNLLRASNTFVERLAAKGYALDLAKWEALESVRKDLQQSTQALQAERNATSAEIGKKKRTGEPAEDLIARMNTVNATLVEQEAALEKVLQEIEHYLLYIPNVPHESVPRGHSEKDNVVVRTVGSIPQFNFTVRDHVDLALGLNGFMPEEAVLLSGARFSVLSGSVAALSRALVQFMMKMHTEVHGYTEVNVPLLVQGEILQGTGQLPKFEEDLFAIKGESGLYLIPTSEVPVTNLVRDKILSEEVLPLNWVCYSPCFRSEAGTYGKDTRGILRQHQFEKVELVTVTKPEDSYAALERLTGHAEKILQALGLPYQVMALCTKDLGFSAAKTYDLEVWIPSQNCYREISSCSNMEDFQARRMQARFRAKGGTGAPHLVHTLNGSALAVGRTLIAVLENYQQPDGSVVIPEALRPFMGGVDRLKP